MMYKVKVLLIISVYFSIFESSCQKKYFQGVITYDMDYIDETGRMSKEETKQYIGNEQKYFIKENKYKSVMNGLLNVTQFYTGRDTLYSTVKGTNAVMYIDTKYQKEKVISSVIKKNQLTILGYSCNVLEIKTTDGTMKYYFNKSVKVDKDLYKDYKKGFWYFCLENTDGALPLKWVTETSGLKLSVKAKKIDSKVLDDSIFDLPRNMPIIKSPE